MIWARFFKSFTPERGLAFIYWTPKQKRLGSKGARQESVPQGASESQATENKTSFVELYPVGR
jgi:hypothetical protein